jgi:hypothetical protein
MDIRQLEKELDNLGIPKDYYSINGQLVSDTYMLNQVYTKWEYFYFDEKGNKEGYKSFDNENKACEYFLEKLKNEIKYPTSIFQ